ncbi:hypothetical protein TI39_contig4202g00033 [Zymoseptoria brevis]|uniref:Uncharacterized protein n=1 Tax=Zymoseptoria brevis TaxID=1047168 RepID=A0A0F4GAF4_9PEZI|nr:hypothetical protein TI39_contig4202g00033 [Zymoseptoria brevis]
MSSLHLKIRKRNRAYISYEPKPPPQPPPLPISFFAKIIFHPNTRPRDIPLLTGLRRDTRTVTLTIDFLSSIDSNSTHDVDSMPMEELANSVCRGPEQLTVHCKVSRKKKFSLFRHWVLMQRFEKALRRGDGEWARPAVYTERDPSEDATFSPIQSPTRFGSEAVTTSGDGKEV